MHIQWLQLNCWTQVLFFFIGSKMSSKLIKLWRKQRKGKRKRKEYVYDPFSSFFLCKITHFLFPYCFEYLQNIPKFVVSYFSINLIAIFFNVVHIRAKDFTMWISFFFFFYFFFFFVLKKKRAEQIYHHFFFFHRCHNSFLSFLGVLRFTLCLNTHGYVKKNKILFFSFFFARRRFNKL